MHEESDLGWDPAVAGIMVRLRGNPAHIGRTTGEVKTTGSYLSAHIDFGPNDRSWKRVAILEPVEDHVGPIEQIASGRFGGPADLNRLLTFHKVKGDLTNVFYSMEATRAEFMAHQFKPVLRFVESPVGRLLLADEVGLGKTIESMYIWKELQAREGARRLLVVCPAMLREKWQRDLQNLFNIFTEVETATGLLNRLRRARDRDLSHTFACVAGIQSLRPPRDYKDRDGARAELAQFLDDTPVSDQFAPFDLVIIDEAHDLRNPSTSNNLLGRLLRDSARHLLLLTATPIQLGNENLFQLLKLVDEERFSHEMIFDEIIQANAPIVRLMRQAWRRPPDLEAICRDAQAARSHSAFRADPVIARVEERVANTSELSAPDQVEIARMIESRSLLDQYMCRSRKREVFKDRVVRSATVLPVRFSEPEDRVYKAISAHIKRKLGDGPTGWQFPLITLQRQMASSLPAAVAAYSSSEDLGDVLREYAWEDLLPSDLKLFEENSDSQPLRAVLPDIPVSVATLEQADQKYRELLRFLRETLTHNSREKTIVFAFFRKTLEYLHRRLKADGVDSTLLMGGMKDPNSIIDRFSKPDGPSVLLSSEVGSEGLDLQFCRCLVNYDLPWNPMKVEQRIGRLDRIGQKAERITILNLVVESTIEDRVLSRLYERIDLFKQSIGDLEEILGQRTDSLFSGLIDPRLTEEERLQRVEEAALAIENARKEQERLERDAANLYGLSDYINHRINESREQRRWLGSDDLFAYVTDFFALQYPGTVIDTNDEETGRAVIQLSLDAQKELADHIRRTSPPVRTVLHETSRAVAVSFDPTIRIPSGVESVTVSHPLIRWIQEVHDREGKRLHPISAVSVSTETEEVEAGDFAFVVQLWRLSGVRQEKVLQYRAQRLADGYFLDSTQSERLVQDAARIGSGIRNVEELLGDPLVVMAAARACDDALTNTYAEKLDDFLAENEARCTQQEESVRRFALRKIGDIDARISRLESEGKPRTVPAERGKIQKLEIQLDTQIRNIERQRIVDDERKVLAAGVIRILKQDSE